MLVRFLGFLMILVLSARADDRFGVVTHYSQGWNVNSMPYILATGASWIRDELTWGAIESTKGIYSLPPGFMTWINAAQQNGLKLDLLVSYGNPLYSDQYDSVAMPLAMGWLAGQLKAFPCVQSIEILNEPNNDYQSKEGPNWKQMYVTLLNRCYAAIKAVYPQLQVIGLGAQLGDNLTMLQLGPVQADGLTSHPYPPSAIIPENVYEPPDTTFVQFLKDFRAADPRPQWHTEWGAATCQGDGWDISEYQQNVFCVRRLCESMGMGVNHTFFYDLRDEDFNRSSCYSQSGIFDAQMKPKQAYYGISRTMSNLAGLLPGNGVYVNRSYSDANFDYANFFGYSFTGNGTSVGVVWFGNAYPSPLSITHQGRISFTHPNTHSVMAFNLITGATRKVSWSQWQDQAVVLSALVSTEPIMYIAR